MMQSSNNGTSLSVLVSGQLPPALTSIASDDGKILSTIPIAKDGTSFGSVRIDSGKLILGIRDSAGSHTAIFGVSISEGHVEQLGLESGYVRPVALTHDGSHLLALNMKDFRPTSVLQLPLPVSWRSEATSSIAHQGVLWVGRTHLQTFGTEPITMARISDETDRKLSWQTIDVPITPYNSLLLTSDQRRLYAIDWFPQSITVIDLTAQPPKKIRTASFGQQRFKRPPCGATLSQADDRIYILANKGNTPDGIVVFNTQDLRRIAHWSQNEDRWQCISASRDGAHLFVLTDRGVVILDTQSGKITDTIALDVPDCCVEII